MRCFVSHTGNAQVCLRRQPALFITPHCQRTVVDADHRGGWTQIFGGKAPSTLATNEISSFRQSRNKLNMFNLFRLCRKDEISLDIVAETGNIVAKNGNNIEATFDIVERIVKLVAFDNVASTLLLVWIDGA